MMINTNVSALKAQNSSRVASNMLDTAMERLSSGKRINSAKDDAAGLAIATRMDAKVRGLNQAIRNSNDGISLAQTAEGGMSEISNILIRMRELAVQSANGTQTTEDRTAMQTEVTALTAQITDIGSRTDFNGTKLLDGTAAVNIQTGVDTGQTVSITIASANDNDPPVANADAYVADQDGVLTADGAAHPAGVLANDSSPEARPLTASMLTQPTHGAIIFNGEGRRRTLTHAELYKEVSRFAGALRRAGVQPGDRVAGYLPNLPETIVAALGDKAHFLGPPQQLALFAETA